MYFILFHQDDRTYGSRLVLTETGHAYHLAYYIRLRDPCFFISLGEILISKYDVTARLVGL